METPTGIELGEPSSYTSLLDAVQLAFSLVFIFGPGLIYVPQYIDIVQEKGDGFSDKTCFVLLSANILRLFFWFGQPFDIGLVYQAVFMIIVMIILLEACVRQKSRRPRVPGGPRSLFDPRSFWDWDSFAHYLAFLGAFVAVAGGLTYVFLNNNAFVQGLGTTALLIESMVPFPQAYRLTMTGSTEGLSKFLVWNWLLGDVAKSIYFYAVDAPFQFLMCGGIQIAQDCFVLLQIRRFSENEKRSNHLPVSHNDSAIRLDNF